MRLLGLKGKVFRLFLLIFITTPLILNASNITGVIVDAQNNSPMPQATVRLLSARDSSFVKGAASDIDGKFLLSNIANGRYVLQVDFIGYAKNDQPVRIVGSNLNVGNISMKETSIMLKETTIVGVKTEVKVAQDTVEYNADSYKTQPNAVVEDLLKRLPGVEVSSDGKITSQGKEITKILIDGKEFFADDPKVATKNIPVEMVNKVQVVDRKSDLARTTGVDDGEDETVINLTVKKGMNQGWFGNITAGYGTDGRYEGNLIVNRFWDGNQITIIGGANNTNNLAFSDGGSGRFSRFGGVNGIKSSQNLGVNFTIGKEEGLRVGGSVMYSHSDQDTRQRMEREYLFSDSSSYYKSNSIARDKGHNLRGDFRLQWTIDSLNVFEFRPNFSYNNNNSWKNDTSVTNAGDIARTLINRSQNNYKSSGNSFEFGGELVFNHKFKNHPGRSYSAQLRYQLSNVNENGDTYTKNTYYLKDEEDITDQTYSNHTWSNSIRTRLTWTEPLGDIKNARFLTFSYMAQYRFNNADKLVYDKNNDGSSTATTQSVNEEYYRNSISLSEDLKRHLVSEYSDYVFTNPELLRAALEDNAVLNEDLSNQFRNEFFNQSMRVGFKQVRKLYNLDLGVSVDPSMSKSTNLMDAAKNIPTRWVWNMAPYARFRYKFSTSNSLAADYRARTSQPTMAQLQPVADMSNPLRIVIGNPDLKPTFTNRVNVRYNNFDEASQRSLMFMAGGQFSTNSIVSKTINNSETGAQTTTYTNVNGEWNVMLMGMISLPLRNKSFSFSNNLFSRFQNSKGFINGIDNSSRNLSVNESFSFAYRTNVLELEIRPYYNLQYTTNTLKTTSVPLVHTYGGNFNANYYLPFGLSVGSELSYTGSKGYSDGYNSNQWIWNANISYQFLKGKAATFTAKVYDILHQKQNISRSVTASYIQDVEYNSLNRYAMFSFTYRFNTFGSGNEPKSQTDDFSRRRPGPPRD